MSLFYHRNEPITAEKRLCLVYHKEEHTEYLVLGYFDMASTTLKPVILKKACLLDIELKPEAFNLCSTGIMSSEESERSLRIALRHTYEMIVLDRYTSIRLVSKKAEAAIEDLRNTVCSQE